MSAPRNINLASFAVADDEFGGRAHPEPKDPLHTPFQVDRHRVINATAFRRLEHKTQVFAPSFHDHFRTRLTHTLEVANVGRTLAGHLRVNADLAEVICLAHDLGHPPFGHAGESALREAMAAHGGFDHNAHSLRVVEFLEHPYAAFRGLNLTQAVRDGMRRHETRYDQPATWGTAATDNQTNRRGNEAMVLQPSVEAQIASLADRLAFNLHDLEDAIGAELLTLLDLQSVELWRSAMTRLALDRRVATIHAVRRPVLDEALNVILRDALNESTRFLAGLRSSPQSPPAKGPFVRLSGECERQLTQVEEFLMERVYRKPEVTARDDEGRRMVTRLFEAYRRNPNQLPDRFRSRMDDQGLERVICDYLAGMTDRFARREYDRLNCL